MEKDMINNKLNTLGKLRKSVNDMSESLNARRKIWEEENNLEIEQIKTKKEIIDGVETELRTLALEEYAITNDKKLTGGLGIRVMKKIEYDNEKAFKWAKEHSLALSLDKKKFEKLAKSESLDFVEFKENIIATIPTKI